MSCLNTERRLLREHGNGINLDLSTQLIPATVQAEKGTMFTLQHLKAVTSRLKPEADLPGVSGFQANPE